jgi:hypothetical protein
MLEGNPSHEVWQISGTANWVDIIGNVKETAEI